LQFYGLPFRFENKRTSPRRQELELRSGTHQVPVLQTPENWMLADTTPIIDILDGRVPTRRLFPTGPLGVLTHIVEDYLDEWTARVMNWLRACGLDALYQPERSGWERVN
jgi:glutathione S-transferase